MPRVSILLPAFNPGDDWPVALQSVLQQTYAHLEVVIVDDGSHSPVPIPEDSRIRLIQTPHRGIVHALNTAIHAASGKYLARMDTDDVMDVTRIEKQVQYLEAHPKVDLVASQVHVPDDLSEGLRHYMRWQNELLTHEAMFTHRYADAVVIHPTVMMRATSVAKFGPYQSGVGPEDFDMWLRWLQAGAVFAKINEPLLHWRDHPSRLTRTSKDCDRDHFFRLKAKYLVEWLTRQGIKPPVWVCGRSKQVFQRAAYLESFGLKIAGFVDVTPAKGQTTRTIISYEALHPASHPLLLSYVSDRVGKTRIRDFAVQAGYREGENFYLMA